jgi:hypothetical protein
MTALHLRYELRGQMVARKWTGPTRLAFYGESFSMSYLPKRLARSE